MFAIRQHQWLAIASRDMLQRAPQDSLLVLADHTLRRERYGPRHLARRVQRFPAVNPLVALTANRIADQAPGNAAQPEPQLARLAKLAGVLTDAEKALIEQRFRDLEANPYASVPWEEAKLRLMASLK